ncbi:hypothetical protein C1H46_005492 [Malus baccata]|uniref:Uncharacterized protein n=1 Tax=Malus baccata TaxID=106549 RepID=A0A540NCX4_MALBA|nr:hypothetical protein C1H46_005492 [Malus baccata]
MNLKAIIKNHASQVHWSFSLQRIRLRHESGKLHPDIKHRVRASSNDAQFSLFSEENEVQASSFTEFITSEQVKVVTMLALALALCNANRVMLSVAIVPLSLSNGWSRSFAGIVQLRECYQTPKN